MAVAVRSSTVAAAARGGAPVLGALVGCCLFAAFAGGAAKQAEEVWLQLALAVVALATAGAWLGGGRLAVRAPRAAWLGVALLAAFAAWSGLTLGWSVAPDRTWASTNRAIAYALVAGLAIVAGASAARAIERFAAAWLAVSCAVALYALAGKVAPGVVDHTQLTGRLRAPLEYWNALAAVCAFGVPVGVRVATDVTRGVLGRLGGLAACFLLLLVIGMTYSRGGLVAVAVGVLVLLVAGGPRLRAVGALGLAAACALPALAVAFGDPALSGEGVPLAPRVDAGARLAVWCLLGLVALLAVARVWLAREARVVARVPSARVWSALARAAVVAVALALLAVAATEDGLDGTARAAVERFTQPGGAAVGDPGRLGSAASGNRWGWWQEAVGAWADKPLGGWGAGSFEVVHRLYRTAPLDVRQPHDVPLQWLAETGLVGLLLAAGGLGLLGAAAVVRVRRLPAGRERDLAGALLAIAVVWAAHALFEWDWDIPGVTLPALVALGVLAARPGAQAPARHVGDFVDPEERGAGARTAGIGVAALAAGAFALSAILPAWSDSKAGAAQAAASATRDPGVLAAAARDAEVAARLDPLAVQPLLAAAAIAEGRGRLDEARAALLRAVRRQPWSARAWARLSETALALADRRGAARAAERWLELDPASPAAQRAKQATMTLRTAPTESPTATGTPLPAAPAAPPPPAPAPAP